MQYFIGVQLDGSEHVEPQYNCIPEDTAKESEKMVINVLYLDYLAIVYSNLL